MNRLSKIASIVTMLSFVCCLVTPVSGHPRDGNRTSAQMAGSEGDSAANDSSASDPGFQENPGVKKVAKKFPWLLVGAGAVAVAALALLFKGKKDVPGDGGNGNGGINFNGNIEYGTMTDIDGNVYRTVRIGSQEWMAENLKTTRYRNGGPIPNIRVDSEWFNLTSGAFCEYDNNIENASAYGRLYNWYAVTDGRGLAPAGWHVPSYAEWITLQNRLGGETIAGGKLKEAGLSHWTSPNAEATNESGFTALPGGYRNPDGPFRHIGDIGFWWTATEVAGNEYRKARRLSLEYFNGGLNWADYYVMGGFSVRCVRD